MLSVKMIPRQPSVDINTVIFTTTQTADDFFEMLAKEVRLNPKKTQKAISLYSSTITMLISTFLAQPAVATAVDIDPDLRKTLIILMGLIACLSVAAAFMAWMAAGVWKMFFGGSQADQWTINIIKGFVQVISAPVVITLIVWLFVKLFGNLPAFHIIEEGVKVWFQME